MDLRVERLYSLPDAEAWNVYRALTTLPGYDRPEIHLKGALLAHGLGKHHSAHYAILEALAGGPSGELGGRVRFVYAEILREIGRIDAAIEQFSSWLDGLDEYRSLAPSHQGACCYNLALAFRQAGRYEESIALYQQATAEFRRREHPAWLRMCLQNLAWVACLAGESQIAAEALAEAGRYCETPSAAWQQRIGEAFLAATAPDGDLRRVMVLCQEIIDCTDADVPADVRSHACWLAGRVAMELELPADAEALTTQALIWGSLAGDANRCLRDAAALLAELRTRLNR